ncbi:MAG: glycine zipper 2TM domain-containing protein [Proteobacteria bacterium]|nr:glycine zipper 2TM domain-containing protein [Pseudomonadota bacterium]
MKRQFLRFLALMSVATVCAAANEVSSPAMEAAKKNAANRYAEDQKICGDESTPTRRMQCLRDAKDEYNRALNVAEGKPATEPRPAAEVQPATEVKASTPPPPQVCNDCGRVTGVRVIEKEGEGSAAGMIGGAVVGGLLGHQIGRGRGRDVATVAGAAGGAYAGNKIEGKMKTTKTWSVSVHFDNGSDRTYNFDTDPGLIAGDTVRASGSGIVRR